MLSLFSSLFYGLCFIFFVATAQLSFISFSISSCNFLPSKQKQDTRGGFYSFTLGRISTQLQNDAFGLQNGAFNCSESDGVFLGSEKDLS